MSVVAGYVFAIGGNSDPVIVVKEAAERGVYAVYMKSSAGASFEGALADYISMKPGDNIYSFCKSVNHKQATEREKAPFLSLYKQKNLIQI